MAYLAQLCRNKPLKTFRNDSVKFDLQQSTSLPARLVIIIPILTILIIPIIVLPVAWIKG